MAKKKKASSSGKNAAKTQSPGRPRFDSVQRLLYRFYEPLLLLHTLSPTMGEHLPYHTDDDAHFLSTQRLRRRFLDDLAYFCDYDKGGDTVTAIAIEDRPQGPIFWLASNTKTGAKVKDFLEEVLNRLKQSSSLEANGPEGLSTALTHRAIDFGRQRIKKYCSLLGPFLSRAFKALNRQESAEAQPGA